MIYSLQAKICYCGLQKVTTQALSFEMLDSKSLHDLLKPLKNGPINCLVFITADLIFNSIVGMLQKKGRNFQIIEVNGLNSEPTHIYQSFYGLWKAYHDIFYHMDLIYEISKINKSHGYETVKVKKFVNGIIRIVAL